MNACPACGAQKDKRSRLCTEYRRKARTVKVVTVEGCVLPLASVHSACRQRSYQAAWARAHGPLGDGLVLHQRCSRRQSCCDCRDELF